MFRIFFNGTHKYCCKGLKQPLFIRGKTSDASSFMQIFLFEDCKLPVEIKPKLIIDGGAYVGYSSIYFANKYPDADIIAVEPSLSNHAALNRNVASYPKVKTVYAGLWNKETKLRITNHNEEWSFRVEETNKLSTVNAVTIGSLLRDSEHNVIDILKLDIEGSEKVIFSSGYEDWLGKVKVLIIEFHDRFYAGCMEAVHSALKKYNFKSYDKGYSQYTFVNLDINGNR